MVNRAALDSAARDNRHGAEFRGPHGRVHVRGVEFGTAIQSLAVASLRRWFYDRAKLHQGEASQAQHNGYTPRQSRQADARQVRCIDFERAFAILTPDDRIPLLLVYRDQLPLKHVADILGCSPRLALYHADSGLAKLTDVLDRLHLARGNTSATTIFVLALMHLLGHRAYGSYGCHRMLHLGRV